MDAHDRSQLLLDWQHHHASLSGDVEVLNLGASPDAQLRVKRPFASRHHAHIERRKGDFVLVDHSTNGTFVQTEDEQITFLRRAEMRLWGDGWISLGEPLTPDAAIRFENRVHGWNRTIKLKTGPAAGLLPHVIICYAF